MIVISSDETDEFLANEHVEFSEEQLDFFKRAKKIYRDAGDKSIKDKGCDTTIHYVITDTKDGQIDAALDIPIEYIEKEYELEPPTTYTKFEKQIAILFDKCFSTLIRKDVEYAGHGDAFEAFREAAKVEGVIPEEIARRYRLKHDMSLKKMINDLQNGRDENLTEEFIIEKCGDIICYTALIYGMLMERIRDEVQICE